MENNGIILYYKGTSGFCEYFLLEDLKEWELLELQNKYYTEPAYIEKCGCGKLYLAEHSNECLRCEKLRDDCD